MHYLSSAPRKFDELETNTKITNTTDLYRCINDFRKGHHPRTNIVMDGKSDLVPVSHSILARWRNHFSQLFNVHGVNDFRQTEIHTAEPPEPELNAFEVEMAIDKLKSHKSPGTEQISAEMTKAGGGTICYEIHKLITSIWNKESFVFQFAIQKFKH